MEALLKRVVHNRLVRYPYCKEVRNMLAKKTSKNQVTLPKAIADEFPGIDYFDVAVKDNRIIMIPAKITKIGESLQNIRGKMKKLGIADKDVFDAVRWARKRKR